MHVKIASKILTEIKSRSIDKMQDIEDEIMTTRKITGENKQDLINILGVQNDLNDKLRVIIIMVLCLKDMGELSKMLEIIKNSQMSP